MLALISGLIMACALLFKPVKHNKPLKKILMKDVFNMSLVKNKRYIIWASGIAISLFGYFVPYVYMLKFVEQNFEKGTDTKLPILCIGITSGLGRLLFGYVADLPKVNRIYLQQLSFLVIGIFTMLLPFTTGNYGYLIFITLGMGLFDGCFISLLGKCFNWFTVGKYQFFLLRSDASALLTFGTTKNYLSFRISRPFFEVPNIYLVFVIIHMKCSTKGKFTKFTVHQEFI